MQTLQSTTGTNATREAQVHWNDFAAARAAGVVAFDVGNRYVYGASATALIQSFENACARNTHVLFKADNEPTAFIPPHMLPKHPGLKPPQLEAMSLFQSSLLPAMSLIELAMMLRRNTRCDKSTLAAAVILMVRFCEMTKQKPTLHMMHRMLVVALQVATKAHSDVFLGNDVAARLCGLSLAEMNRLEISLITGCQCHLQVTNEEICVDALVAADRVEGLVLRAGSVAPLFIPPLEPVTPAVLANPSSNVSSPGCRASPCEPLSNNESFYLAGDIVSEASQSGTQSSVSSPLR